MTSLTPALLTDASALVPGSTAFLAVVLMAGTVALVLRTVSWAVAAQADRLFLGAAYVVASAASSRPATLRSCSHHQR